MEIKTMNKNDSQMIIALVIITLLTIVLFVWAEPIAILLTK